MRRKFADTHYPAHGKFLQVFWCDAQGVWLCDRALGKPFYRRHRAGCWTRYYRVELQEGERVYCWTKRHRASFWVLYQVRGKELDAVETGARWPFAEPLDSAPTV